MIIVKSRRVLRLHTFSKACLGMMLRLSSTECFVLRLRLASISGRGIMLHPALIIYLGLGLCSLSKASHGRKLRLSATEGLGMMMHQSSIAVPGLRLHFLPIASLFFGWFLCRVYQK